jgi:hypothetical protein
MSNILMQVALRIKARDYAAFEDLAESLGVTIDDVTIIRCEKESKPIPVSTKKPITRYYIDQAEQDTIIAIHNAASGLSTAEVLAASKVPCSKNTVERVLNYHTEGKSFIAERR